MNNSFEKGALVGDSGGWIEAKQPPEIITSQPVHSVPAHVSLFFSQFLLALKYNR